MDRETGKTADGQSGEVDEQESKTFQRPSHYVGIGASAGGLEAIETFFSNMHPQNGMAFIVIQHLSPDYKSMMVELLSKRTEMRVLRAEEGMPVEADTIYLIPPKKNLSIFHGKLLLTEQDHGRGINLPIDVFLRSLAEDQAERSVGIILSGTGSDGVRGIRSIKEAGGMVMVQDEETAKFDGMPRAAIGTGLADFVLAPENMPGQLLSFAKHPRMAKGERPEALLTDEDGLNRIFSMLRDRTKVDFTYYKPSTVVRRIERRMTINQVNELRDYVKYMESYPAEVSTLYRELLIGVTSFFRDREAFELLENKYLPEIMNNASGRDLRLWVAGCSTGEEAYSLAILCREVMEKIGRQYDVKIFATDIDRDAILFAGNGAYPASIAADLSPRILTKYFHHEYDNYHIGRTIREMVVFAQHNLIRDPPFTNIDLISCRNLLIYLQPVLQKKILDLFNFSLNSSGILFLGSSESTGEMSDFFEPLDHKWKLYRSKGRKRMPGGGVDPSQALFDLRGRLTNVRAAGGGGAHMRAYEEERILDRLLQGLAGDYLPLTLVVNEHNEILHSLGETEGVLRIPAGKMQNDITKMAQKDLAIPLATGIQKAFKNNEEVKFTNIRIAQAGHSQVLNLRIKPLPRKKGQEPLAVIFIELIKKPETDQESCETETYDLGREAEQRINDLEQELQFTRENLQATIEELETSNEELQATNEELLASNEELQSTNEELQSVNEELHTVNAEYQSKIMELTELNNDMDNLFHGIRIPTLFLDDNLEIRKFTPDIKSIAKLGEKDIGRELATTAHNLLGVDFNGVVEKVRDDSEPRELEVETREGAHYLMRALPYEVGKEAFSGVIVTFTEITKLEKTKLSLEKSEARLRETSRLAKVGYWEYLPATNEHNWTDELYRIHELPPGQQPSPDEGINFYDEESRPKITQAFTRAVEKGEPYDLVLRIVTARGNRRWVRAMGKPVMNGGRVVKVSGSFQDITDITEMEEARREVEDRYRMLFEKTMNGVALLESVSNDDGEAADFKFIEVNQAFRDIAGAPGEPLVGKRAAEVFTNIASREMDWLGELARVAREGKTFSAETDSEKLGKRIRLMAYSPEPGRVVTIIDEAASK